jgi:surface antigen
MDLRRTALLAICGVTWLFSGTANAAYPSLSTGADVQCSRSDYACTTGGYAGRDPWGYYEHGSKDAAGRWHNCTAYAAYRVARNGAAEPSWRGNARDWDDLARAAGMRVDSTPAPGAVAVWNYGEFGHVAYVESVDFGGLLITDDNFTTKITRRVWIPAGSVGWPDSFIHFADLEGGMKFYGDWDGNGTVTPGIVYRIRGVGLEWHLRNSNSAGPAHRIFRYGDWTDVPVVGDWNGNRTDSVGIARRRPGLGLEWHLRNLNSAGPADAIFRYGKSTDVPVTGNWDTAGGDTVGVARRIPGVGLEWHLRNAVSGGPAHAIFRYGLETDLPVAGDWDGYRSDTVGIARRRPGLGLEWHLRNANTGGPAHTIFRYGKSNDVPVVGDWNGNGSDTIGIARPIPGIGVEWHLRNANSAGPASAIFRYGGAHAATSG